jgi:hypothetical protein
VGFRRGVRCSEQHRGSRRQRLCFSWRWHPFTISSSLRRTTRHHKTRLAEWSATPETSRWSHQSKKLLSLTVQFRRTTDCGNPGRTGAGGGTRRSSATFHPGFPTIEAADAPVTVDAAQTSDAEGVICRSGSPRRLQGRIGLVAARPPHHPSAAVIRKAPHVEPRQIRECRAAHMRRVIPKKTKTPEPTKCGGTSLRSTE